jgi:hypothetical protein
MYAFSLPAEQRFDARKHVERVLGTTGEGDVAVAVNAHARKFDGV